MRGGWLTEAIYKSCDFSTKNPISLCKTILLLCNLVQQERIDVIHCHNRIPAICAQICHRLTGVPFVWTLHNIPIACDFLRRKMTFVGNAAVAISQESAVFIETKLCVRKSKIALINNGVSLQGLSPVSPAEKMHLRKKFNMKSDEKAIILLGRLAPQKGHSFLLDAVSDLPGNWKLYLTGTGSDEYRKALELQIVALGLEEKVEFTGNVNAREILGAGDILVMPSTHEGFPLVALEAMAMEVPIVRTKCGGYLDMAGCVDGVEYGDVASLKEALIRNLERNAEIDERVRFAAQAVRERWTTEQTVTNYLALYEKVIQER